MKQPVPSSTSTRERDDMSSSPEDLADEAVIAKVLEGHVNVFEVLLERYGGYVFSIVSRHVPRDRVEEVAHEAFVKAYQSLPGIKSPSAFKSWLAKIASRSCYEFWRERRRKPEDSITALSGDRQEWLDALLASRSHEDFRRECRRREAREVLELALQQLCPEDRMVVACIHLEGMSVKETASLLGWSAVTVKVRAHRSRKRLRRFIETLLPQRDFSP